MLLYDTLIPASLFYTFMFVVRRISSAESVIYIGILIEQEVIFRYNVTWSQPMLSPCNSNKDLVLSSQLMPFNIANQSLLEQSFCVNRAQNTTFVGFLYLGSNECCQSTEQVHRQNAMTRLRWQNVAVMQMDVSWTRCHVPNPVMQAVLKWTENNLNASTIVVISNVPDSCLHMNFYSLFAKSGIKFAFSTIADSNSLSDTLVKLRFRRIKDFILVSKDLLNFVITDMLPYESWLLLFQPDNLSMLAKTMSWNTKTSFVNYNISTAVDAGVARLIEMILQASNSSVLSCLIQNVVPMESSFRSNCPINQERLLNHRVDFQTIVPYRSNLVSYLQASFQVESNTLIMLNTSNNYSAYNLQNETFRIIYRQNEPYIFYDSEKNVMAGLCVDIIDEIARQINMSYIFISTAQFSDDNTTWNDVIYGINRNLADIGSCDITVTANRSELVDFSIPWIEEGLGIVIAKPTDTSLLKVFRPFTLSSWGAIAASIIFIGIVTTLISRISPVSLWNLVDSLEVKHSIRDEVSFQQNIWCHFGTFLQQGQDFYPYSYSSRTVTVAWWLSAVVLIASYTANLVAYLTVPNVDAPVHNLAELTMSSIRVMVFGGGNTETIFKTAKADSDFGRLAADESRFQIIAPKMTNPYDIIISQNSNQPYALVADFGQLQFDIRNNCSDIYLLPEKFESKYLAFPLRKGAYFLPAFNFALVRLIETGFIHRMRHNYWRSDVICSMAQPDKLDLSSTAGAFLATLLFFGIAFLMLILEIFLCRRRYYCRKKTTNSDAFPVQQCQLTVPHVTKQDIDFIDAEASPTNHAPCPENKTRIERVTELGFKFGVADISECTHL